MSKKKKSTKKNHGKAKAIKNEAEEQSYDSEDSVEEEERPVPKKLVAFAIFFAIVFVLVAGYFQNLPKDRFPEQFSQKVNHAEQFDDRQPTLDF